MKKQEIGEIILGEVIKIDANIVKVYGVGCGVGYDLDIVITFKSGYQKEIDAHAGPKSWGVPGHLRDRQYSFYNYTGKNDCYRERVIHYWCYDVGFETYLSYLTKNELESLLKEATKK